MADLQFDPKFYSALDALNRGSQDSNILARQRAEAMLSQIDARRRDEVIDAEMAQKKAMAEAYRMQVQAQMAKAQGDKPYDLARATDLQRQQSFAPLNAIYEQMNTNVPGAAQGYEQLKQRGLIPPDLEAMEGPEAQFTNPGMKDPILSRFNPEIMKGYLEGLGRPKTVADLQKRGMQEEGLGARSDADRASRERIAAMQAQAKQALEALKAGTLSKENFENWVTRQMREGTLDPQEGIALVMEARQAAAGAGAGQTTPTIDLAPLGVPTTTPLEQRQRIQGTPAPNQKRRPLDSFNK